MSDLKLYSDARIFAVLPGNGAAADVQLYASEREAEDALTDLAYKDRARDFEAWCEEEGCIVSAEAAAAFLARDAEDHIYGPLDDVVARRDFRQPVVSALSALGASHE